MNENTHQIQDLKTALSRLTDSISSIKADMINGVVLKFSDIKSEYINDVKSIINSNTIETVGPLLERNIDTLIDKTRLIVEDVIPKNQTQHHAEIQDTIKTFHQSISDDTASLLKYIDSHSMKDYIQNFEIKSSMLLQNVQQPIYSFISASEERLASNINGIKDSSASSLIVHNKLLTDLNEFLAKNRLSEISTSSRNTDLSTGIVLNQMFHTAEIINKSKGILTMKRHQAKPKILFHSKVDNMNITTDEIAAFLKDVEENNCSGILLSHHSGITSKPNYHIEIQRGNIIVFVHHAEFSNEKMKIAIDIIDTLSIKLKELNTSENNGYESTIPKPLLDEINKEYQLFITQKEAIVTVFKESQRKVLSQVDELKFPSLERFLSTKFSVSVPKHGFKCDLCTCFTGNNLKALAAHKRGCIKKQPPRQNNSIGNSLNQENMPIPSYQMLGNIVDNIVI